MPLIRRLPQLSLALVLLWGTGTLAQDPASRPAQPAQPGEGKPKEGEEAEGEEAEGGKPAPKPPETLVEKHARVLRETTVHFDFRRAPIEDILRALSKASDVPIALGRTAKQVLDKRKFKIKYVASRRGDQVLTDLCKAAALDFLIRAEGVLVDLPGRIRKLRKAKGLKGKSVKLTPKDVTKALTTKSLSITATKKSLESVLVFLRSETGIPFVQLSEERKRGAAPLVVTLSLTSVPLAELLDKITHPLGLDWIQRGRVILVGSAKAIAEQRKPVEGEKPGEKKPGEKKPGEKLPGEKQPGEKQPVPEGVR